ncbi:two-component system sensor histidine kinase UhpB [Methylopila capsulata]|uniref:Sensor histidine kinase n=1 Tax=Methylopila capsulata TaxID=61654 RepID=A0A9W6MQV7_9HYPH|nr:ATP-binding protein [Methylopila capsulata]MBM7851554.1 two-component system sensor histidine kinase UhpB [Methylopila capsulata]GLK54612.1 sensor histidine kinase [Methylopila capsulata]
MSEQTVRFARLAAFARPAPAARSLRLRILGVVAAIDVACCLAAGVVTVINAREATRVEIAASLEIAEPFVRETLIRLQRDLGRLRSIADVQVALPGVRHVRIVVYDGAGREVATRPAQSAHGEGEEPPAWFAALIAPPPERRVVPVLIDGEREGEVVIHGEAADEIAEVWEDLLSLAALFVTLNALGLAVFAAALGRVLAPLGALAQGLSDLERRRLDRPLPTPASRELAALTERFNRLAEALGAERATNARLSWRMITLQDDERRRIAKELHDELGPCLFGLRANLASLERAVAPGVAAGALGPEAGERIATVIELSERLSGANVRLLRSLRPIALGEAPLADVVRGLIADFERLHPDRAFALDAEGLKAGYGEVVDLTVYRCVQEGVTNALRHAACSRVDVRLSEGPDAEGEPAVLIAVRDDGAGVADGAREGFGLVGLGERVQALGGRFRLHSRFGGAALEVALPLVPAASPRPQGCPS